MDYTTTSLAEKFIHNLPQLARFDQICVVLFSHTVHTYSMGKRASDNYKGSPPLLDDSNYNIIHQLEKKSDFLYSAVENYIRDAEKDKKLELVELWNKIKEDEQNHLRMLKEELVREAKQDRFE